MNQKPESAPELHLIGAGGLASDFIACFKDILKISGCWDDNLVAGSSFNSIPVLGSVAELVSLKNPIQAIITIGNPSARMKIGAMLSNSVHTSPVVIHPDARLYDKEQIELGSGCIIFPGVFLTTKIRIGAHSIVHIGTSVHHDVTVGDFSVLMPGVRLTGNVNAGRAVFFAPGQSVSHGVTIGDGERIG